LRAPVRCNGCSQIAPAPVRHKTVDFTDGEPLPPPHAGPPVIKNESLIPDRYRKGLGKPKK
jgi:hypothetical protein